LNKSSKALRAPEVPDGRVEPVSRSTWIRGEKNVQVFWASFGLTRAGTGSLHSNRAPGSNEAQLPQV
jgi:hypothetical protein